MAFLNSFPIKYQAVSAWNKMADTPLTITELTDLYIASDSIWWHSTWTMLLEVMAIVIDTEIAVRVASPVGRCGEIAESQMTPLWSKVEVSISNISWCHQFCYIYTDSGVCKQEIVQKIASNQSLWRARRQTIQPPKLRLGSYCGIKVLPVSLNLDNMHQWKLA